MSDVAIETVTLEEERADPTRLPLGVVLLIGAGASMSLWSLAVVAMKVLLG